LCARACSRRAGKQLRFRARCISGIPTIPDTDPMANPRGFGLKFQLPGGAITDLVAHSVNGFPVGTAEEFLEFLQAIVASTPEASHPNAIEKFVSVRPAAIAFVSATPLPPVSFANETFFSVNAVRFVNKEGVAKFGRYQVRPVLGQKLVAKQDVPKLAPDFLFADLRERLAKGPVEFELVVQLAHEGDQTNDASTPWPDDREICRSGNASPGQPAGR
jgi:catalase